MSSDHSSDHNSDHNSDRNTGTQAPVGLLLVDKPAGVTSHDVVSRLRAILRTKRVGHAGTLDPMATGLLIIGVGRATKLLGHLALTHKSYAATIRLGQATSTDDADGDMVRAIDAGALSDRQVSDAVAALTGAQMQVPSAVSAIKVDGKRAYERVRAGERVHLAARPVEVSRFDIVGPIRREGACVAVDVEVVCSSGTYVRALARDMGEALGVGGHLTALRRLTTGPFTVIEAQEVYPDGVTERGAPRPPIDDDLRARTAAAVLDVSAAAASAFTARYVEQVLATDLRHGRAVPAAGIAGTYAAFDPSGGLLALLRETGEVAKPVFVWQAG